mgnify:CR=1 FL=1
MFNQNILKKKLQKILLSINRLIESFFDKFKSSNKHTPIKKRFNILDNKIENFFDKFQSWKKYNHSKKKFYNFNNKIFLSVALIFILFLSYFLIPVFFNKNEMKLLIKNQMYKKYEIDINFNENIKYGLLPKPFFYTKNLDINHKNKILGKSNNVKFYITFGNFFINKKPKIKDIIFRNTEFNIKSSDLDFFIKTLNNSEIKDKVIFKKAKLFFKDKNEELLFLSKLNKTNFFYDEKKQIQKLSSQLEIFNTPFDLIVTKDISNRKKKIKLSSKRIRLNIETLIEHDNSNINGIFDIRFINKENLFNYAIKEKTLTFKSEDENFKGELNFKPFYFSSDLKFNYISQKKIFNSETLLIDLLDSELLNNANLNAVFNINIDKIDKFEYLTNFILKVHLDDGRIFMSNFDAKWNDSVLIKSNEIEFINDKDGKKLIGEIIFTFNDVEKFFRYFQIKRNYRNVFEEIKLDFVYDFIQNKIILNNLKIDEKSSKKLTVFLDQYNKKNKNLFNKVTFRNFIKEFFQTYAG